MKTMLSSIAVRMLLLIARPQAFSAVVGRADADVPAPEVQYFISPEDNAVLTEVLRVDPQLPRGPKDNLEDYKAEMGEVTSQMSHDLGEICEATAKNRLLGKQGEYLGQERYQIATMQFQLLSALHAILEQSNAQGSAGQSKDDPSPTGQARAGPAIFLTTLSRFGAISGANARAKFCHHAGDSERTLLLCSTHGRARCDATKAGDGDPECASRPQTNFASAANSG